MENRNIEEKLPPSRILIVDDNEMNLEILKELLEDEYDVISATNGKDTINIVKEEDVNLVLLDVMMPDISGFEVCKVLKSEPNSKQIPIMLVTAKSEISDRVKGLELGADDYVVKPFNFDELLARIRSHLRLYKLQEEITNARIENELNSLKLDFLSIVSHELRTPLHSILGFSELLLSDTSITEKQHNYLNEILAGGTRLKELIENLLLFTQISSNIYTKEKEKVNVNNLIEQIKEIFIVKIEKKNIVIDTSKVDKDLTLIINEEMFNQILFKVIDNAMKFSKKDGKIIISTEHNEKECKLEISDFGVGIPEEIKKNIFKPFEQGNPSYKTRPYNGLGLGLALVLKLVEQINGKIAVKDNEPSGSKFIITIPIK